MLIRLTTFLAAFASLSFSTELRASVDTPTPPPSPSSLSLSIQDAVKMALDENPNIASDRQKLTEIEQTVNYGYAQFFPTLNGVGTATKEKNAVNGSGNVAFGGDAYNSYVAQLVLKQPLYVGGALTHGLSATENEREVRQNTLNIDSRDLSVQVLESYYTTLTSEQVFQILKDTREVEQRTVNTTTNYYKIGRAQLLDVLQAKTTLALLLPQITTAENQMKTAASQLIQLLHQNQASTVALSGPVPFVDPDRVQKFLDKRKEMPEIVRGEKQIAEFHDTAEVQLSVYEPNLSFQGMWGKTANTQPDLLNDYSNNWSVSLQLNVPIFAGLSSIFQRRILNSQEVELQDGQSALVDQLSYNQRQAELNLATAASVLKSSKDADDLSKASLKEAERDFKLQTINYLQLLTSQQNYLSAESSYVQSKYSYIDAVAKYFVATGIPLGNLIDILNK